MCTGVNIVRIIGVGGCLVGSLGSHIVEVEFIF